jgi:hypothetical protein
MIKRGQVQKTRLYRGKRAIDALEFVVQAVGCSIQARCLNFFCAATEYRVTNTKHHFNRPAAKTYR